MFLSDSEQVLSTEYLRQGYVVRPVADADALQWMRVNSSGSVSPF